MINWLQSTAFITSVKGPAKDRGCKASDVIEPGVIKAFDSICKLLYVLQMSTMLLAFNYM